MDQILNKIFRYIPEWLFVLIIIGIGLSLFFMDKPLVSVCDAQISDFAAGQNGKLFPRSVKVINPATGGLFLDNNLQRAKQHCIESPKGTGCYQYFKIIQSVLYDFKKLETKCLKQLSEAPIIGQLFEEYMVTMAILAWGEYPPRSQAQKSGWLGDPELKTFCTVKNYFQDFYPPEKFSSIIQSTLSQLVIDPNTEMKMPANEKTKTEIIKEVVGEDDEDKPYVFEKARMTMQKAYDLSLFSTDCLFYL